MKVANALLLMLLVSSCDVLAPQNDLHDVWVTFSLSDTTGARQSRFRSGSPFQMRFTATNFTGSPLTYYFTGVPVVFEIRRADTVVATSVDDLLFAQVVRSGCIVPYSTFVSDWKAPNSLGRRIPLVLSPGEYEAAIRHATMFHEFALPRTPTVRFTVLP